MAEKKESQADFQQRTFPEKVQRVKAATEAVQQSETATKEEKAKADKARAAAVRVERRLSRGQKKKKGTKPAEAPKKAPKKKTKSWTERAWEAIVGLLPSSTEKDLRGIESDTLGRRKAAEREKVR